MSSLTTKRRQHGCIETEAFHTYWQATSKHRWFFPASDTCRPPEHQNGRPVELFVSTRTSSGNTRPPQAMRPCGQKTVATPPKCEADMTWAAFRTWRKSMEACMQLNEWTPSVSVIHIRLNCVPKIQQTINTRYTGDKWKNITPK